MKMPKKVSCLTVILVALLVVLQVILVSGVVVEAGSSRMVSSPELDVYNIPEKTREKPGKECPFKLTLKNNQNQTDIITITILEREKWEDEGIALSLSRNAIKLSAGTNESLTLSIITPHETWIDKDFTILLSFHSRNNETDLIVPLSFEVFGMYIPGPGAGVLAVSMIIGTFIYGKKRRREEHP